MAADKQDAPQSMIPSSPATADADWQVQDWRARVEAAYLAEDFESLSTVYFGGKHGHHEHFEMGLSLLDRLAPCHAEAGCALAEKLVEIYPHRLGVRSRLGALSEAAGRPERALTAYGHILAYEPASEGMARKVARLLETLGREDEARKTLARQEAFVRLSMENLPPWEDRDDAALDSLSQTRRLYLDLLERTVSNSIYLDGAIAIDKIVPHNNEKRDIGRDIPLYGHTMIGRRRLRHLRRVAETVLRENIPGDFIETGVWRGGACILLRGVLKAHEASERRVFAADSFAGLPPPDPRYPEDSLSLFDFHTRPELAVSRSQVSFNFESYGLLDDQVVFVEGLFKDTMPRLRDQKFSILRLDGDLYSSTMDVLENLYDNVAPGGFIIIDDYGTVIDAKRAVIDFLLSRQITEPMFAIDGDGVYWRKSTD